MSKKSRITTVDVRPDIASGREPFSKIMAAVAKLDPDDSLRLIAPFEPVPLFRVMEAQGFRHSSAQIASGDWEVFFTRVSAPAAELKPAAAAACGCRSAASDEVLEVDARGLEPPQPLVKILEALATLPPGATLRARTDRRPVHLYVQLEDRGFIGETNEHSDASFVTHIRRR